MFIKRSLLIRFRAFEREYSLPLIGTALFALVIFGAVLLRHFEHTSLSGVFEGSSKNGQNYVGLLSNDPSDEFSINQEDESRPDRADNEPDTRSVNQGTSSSDGSSGGSGGSPGPSQNNPFSSSISSYRQTNAQLNCSTPKYNINKCDKRYSFEAVVRSINGPGTISYSWESSVSGADEERNFSVAGGEVFTTINKDITIACKSPGTYNLLIRINSPNVTSSGMINIIHICP